EQVDCYTSQVDELMAWIKKKKISNVIFFTGDPHNTYIQYYDDNYRVLEICTSSIGNYRSNGNQGIFFGDPNLANRNLVALNQNSYADIEVDPKSKTMTVRTCYGRETLGTVVINLV